MHCCCRCKLCFTLLYRSICDACVCHRYVEPREGGKLSTKGQNKYKARTAESIVRIAVAFGRSNCCCSWHTLLLLLLMLLVAGCWLLLLPVAGC